jgi:hypothetical protein
MPKSFIVPSRYLLADYLLAPTGLSNGYDYYLRGPLSYSEDDGYECLFTNLGGTMHGDFNAKLVEMLLIDAAIYVFGVEIVVNFRMAAGCLTEFSKRLRCYFFYVAVSFANRLPKEVSPFVKHRLTEEGLPLNTSSVRARHTTVYIRLWTKLKAMLTYAVRTDNF